MLYSISIVLLVRITWHWVQSLPDMYCYLSLERDPVFYRLVYYPLWHDQYDHDTNCRDEEEEINQISQL